MPLFSAAIFSHSHGTNDAMKTAGIITGVLVASGYLANSEVLISVIFAAHGAIALGALSGGWRIIHTMGRRPLWLPCGKLSRRDFRIRASDGLRRASYRV